MLETFFALSEKDAQKLQLELAPKVIKYDQFSKIRYAAVCDVSSKNEILYGAVVVLKYPTMEIVESEYHNMKVTFPYVPGLLSFREAPVLIPCFKSLKNKFDLLFVDGHGYSHPRHFGIACHLGLALDVPTIGCAKRILRGTIKVVKGICCLEYKNEIVAAQTGSSWISIGHRISLKSAYKLSKSVMGYRYIKPIEVAHQRANEYRILIQSG